MSIREHGRRYHSQPATVAYSSKDLDGIKPPFLKFGDESALKQFRLAFIKYCQKHANAMRRRPYAHRVRPRSVVECIDPDSLMYVCNHELPRKYRTKRPERVSARAVHDWVMRERQNDLGAEDDEGIKKLRNLKLSLNGGDAIRQVQQLFINVRKIRRLYRLRTTQKQIIRWILKNITPEPIKWTIQNILQQDTVKGQRASRKLSAFHRLVMSVAKTFHRSISLGLLKKGKNRQERRKGNKNNNQSGGGGKNGGKDRNGQNGGDKNGGKKKTNKKGELIVCFQCGGNHYVTQCKVVPTERKKWTIAEWIAHKKSTNSDGPTSDQQNTGQQDRTQNSQRRNSSRKRPGGRKNALTTSSDPVGSQDESASESDDSTPGVKKALGSRPKRMKTSQ